MGVAYAISERVIGVSEEIEIKHVSEGFELLSERSVVQCIV
jgi:hypothetical protein